MKRPIAGVTEKQCTGIWPIVRVILNDLSDLDHAPHIFGSDTAFKHPSQRMLGKSYFVTFHAKLRFSRKKFSLC